MTDFIVAIPARYAASRLPGKPLRLLGDRGAMVLGVDLAGVYRCCRHALARMQPLVEQPASTTVSTP